MSAARQLSLFRDASLARPRRCPLDEASEGLLDEFRHIRSADGAHPRSVAREVSQLRSIAREAGGPDAPLPLTELVADMGAVARTLSEPRTRVTRSTNRARWLAIQHFLRAMGSKLDIDPDATLDALDALLPKRADSAWYRTGIVVAGTTNRHRRRGPSLELPDLQRIIDAAAERESGYRAARDRALVALHCFSGLRPGEIHRLRWEDIVMGSATHDAALTVAVERNGKVLHLPVLGPAVAALARHGDGAGGGARGFIFRVAASGPKPISYRAARAIVAQACARAGLSLGVEATSLRAAFAYWLRSQGLSEHEVAAALGIARVRTVDALLEPHMALSAQRRVREILA